MVPRELIRAICWPTVGGGEVIIGLRQDTTHSVPINFNCHWEPNSDNYNYGGWLAGHSLAQPSLPGTRLSLTIIANSFHSLLF